MDVVDLHEYFKRLACSNNTLGEKSKYSIDFVTNYMIENKQTEIMVKQLYKLIDIDISYNQFVRALSKKWKLEKLDGGWLKLNMKNQKSK